MLIRPAAGGDAVGLADVHVRAWRVAYRGLVPQAHLDRMDPVARVPGWEQWIREVRPPAGIFVLDDGGTVAGFVTVSAGPEPGTGEINAIYLAPEHWGQGAGRQLMSFAVDHLTRAGFRESVLWMLGSNERARRFYEAGGWVPDGVSRVDESRGAPLTEIRYRRSLASAAGFASGGPAVSAAGGFAVSAAGGFAAAAPGEEGGGEGADGQGEQADLTG
ncbi:GNAT family N-acetyltransferase [Actinoplanes sp. GCM10030250]|uniref:GNAT family N-acetyltransferase n=1 Tax=Actinoplanes sp. GCM10030250 TaxID=3273376 RepID=UPI00360D458B